MESTEGAEHVRTAEARGHGGTRTTIESPCYSAYSAAAWCVFLRDLRSAKTRPRVDGDAAPRESHRWPRRARSREDRKRRAGGPVSGAHRYDAFRADARS